MSIQDALVQIFPKLAEHVDTGCRRKYRFGFEQDVINTIRTNMKNKRPALYYYRCQFCKGWHLTKRLGPNAKAVQP